jgi:succinate dehydrogenase / fumarate reductase cytochrome b subunit
LTSLALTLTETLRYRGAIGQWSWVLHRVTGLGVVLFLVIHVIDTSWAVFYPALYEKAIAIYQTPLFTIGEFVLVACVVYHALNGLRISIFDNRPALWKYQERAAYGVLGLTVLLLIPTFIIMFAHVIHFYQGDPQVLGLGEVISSQLPFIAGIALAIIAAVLLSALYGLIAGDGGKTATRAAGSRLERFWWSFMRVSGLLIVPLVFGHLIMIHLIQGVFEINTAGQMVVGTNFINESGTAVEFVRDRWTFLLGPVAIWRAYDFALLVLVVVHGFNGLRYVLTDYTMSSNLMRRASVYLCVIGATVLLVLGGAALFGTIDQAAIAIAAEAAANLHP